MNKIIISAALLLLVITCAYYLFVVSNQKPAQETVQETQGAQETVQLVVVSTEVKKTADSLNGAEVYATLSNGETKLIAISDNPETIENYFDIETYREAHVSPDGRFVAVAGSQFEDSIVRVYEASADTLHEIIYGVFSDWTPEGLLKIKSCNLAGRECVDKISTSSQTPWLMK